MGQSKHVAFNRMLLASMRLLWPLTNTTAHSTTLLLGRLHRHDRLIIADGCNMVVLMALNRPSPASHYLFVLYNKARRTSLLAIRQCFLIQGPKTQRLLSATEMPH
jgi:hypothetical protein